jgi:hypothetical protein
MPPAYRLYAPACVRIAPGIPKRKSCRKIGFSFCIINFSLFIIHFCDNIFRAKKESRHGSALLSSIAIGNLSAFVQRPKST